MALNRAQKKELQALVSELTKRKSNQDRIKELMKKFNLTYSCDVVEQMTHVLGFINKAVPNIKRNYEMGI